MVGVVAVVGSGLMDCVCVCVAVCGFVDGSVCVGFCEMNQC